MRTSERLRKLKSWLQSELCDGRSMKAPAQDMDVTKITMQEPRCYLGWTPAMPDRTGVMNADPVSVCPGMLVMPNASYAKNMEEQRFDRYNKVGRPKELGQTLSVSILLSIYEPGIRLPGFAKSAQMPDGPDMSLMLDGTEEGLMTLLDWMDDLKERLLGQKMIPGTDLSVMEQSMLYSLYTDQSFNVDKRPIYYGFVNVTFQCYADEGTNRSIDKYLE
ncbi:MAG: hypothetical protein ACI4PG_06560 [Candidatus Ventricola sp.]